MKILLFSDVHWSTYSSIVRSTGSKYSTRLEYLINSMNWVNSTATDNDCDMMICAGDFFDKSNVTDYEVTALQEINWNNLPCNFLCGNHESSVSDLSVSTVSMLMSDTHTIISKPTTFEGPDFQIHYVPYVVEHQREDLVNYLTNADKAKKQIIISHNDIAGINYGGFESKIGFNIAEIESNCDLYLNGHLHNSEFITKKILNLGSFSGHNFTNDSSRYLYGVWILDTDTLKLEFFENPYSLNFYKFEINSTADIAALKAVKANSVISLRCNASLVQDCKTACDELADKLIEKKITVSHEIETFTADISISDLQTNHLEKFIACCKANIANTEILEQELAEVCK